jgi:hypothetical protein
MSAAVKAEVRTKSAIRSYEEEVGVQVAGSAVLEQVFHQLYLIYLIHATLGEMTFRRLLPHA